MVLINEKLNYRLNCTYININSIGSKVSLDRTYIVHVGYGPLKQWHAHLANGISLNFQSKKYSWEFTSMSTKHLSMNKIEKNMQAWF